MIIDICVCILVNILDHAPGQVRDKVDAVEQTKQCSRPWSEKVVLGLEAVEVVYDNIDRNIIESGHLTKGSSCQSRIFGDL